MHRTHDVESIGRAVGAARTSGFPDISLDLIFALPESLHRDWSRDLEMALALEPTHLSLYGLTVEPRTPVGHWQRRGEIVEAPEERYEAEFLEADRRLTDGGFEHYEVSSFARPGYRARHNSSYWSGVAYAGVGPAAHEFDGERRRWNVAPYAEWAARIGRGMDPVAGVECLTDSDRIAESVYLGLRTSGGLAIADPEVARAAAWIEAGWATIQGSAAGRPGGVDHDLGASLPRLRLTPAGWLRLDSIAADLTVFRSR
jgi:oxygen-independent coproporphyrinogen-3 oxidase